MTAIRIIHGRRVFVFDGNLCPVRVFDDFGGDNITEFRPPEFWASPEAVREAEAMIAAVTEPRRQRAKERG